MENQNSEGKKLFDLFNLSREMKKTRTFNKVMQNQYDENFTARDLQAMYNAPNWGAVLDNHLQGYFEAISENDATEIIKEVMSQIGIEGTGNDDFPFQAIGVSGEGSDNNSGEEVEGEEGIGNDVPNEKEETAKEEKVPEQTDETDELGAGENSEDTGFGDDPKEEPTPDEPEYDDKEEGVGEEPEEVSEEEAKDPEAEEEDEEEEQEQPEEEPDPKEEEQPETKMEVEDIPEGEKMEAKLSFEFPMQEFLERALRIHIDPIVKKFKENFDELVVEEAMKLNPTSISINGVQAGTVTGKKHKDFDKALQRLVAIGNLFLSGEAGTGKTFLSEQLAEALGIPFGSISVTAGISEGYFIGRTNIQGDFISTDFLEIYENGGVFLLDEVDAGDSNTLLILNKAISGKTMPVPMRRENPVAKRHKDFYIVCCANTWGTGTDANYTGREYMDEAFLNRFSVSKMHLDFDEDLERELLSEKPKLYEALLLMRNRIRASGMLRTISTRTMIDCLKFSLSGATDEEVVKALITDYTEEEKLKVLQ